MMHLVIAAGGTGGHMFPAQALAEEMLGRGWRVTLTTDSRGNGYATGFPDAVKRSVLASGTFARGGLVGRAAVPVRIVSGIWAAWRAFRRESVDVVAGFGGYPSIPALGAATLLGIPRMIHEQNGVLGRVNRLFARRVDCVACGTWPIETPGGRTLDIGNPVREAVRAHAGAPYDPNGPILVIGGSQGARILADVVPEALASLPEALRRSVSQQARPEDVARVAAAYDGLCAAEIEPFFQDVPERLVRASLVISRAGASSIADISAVGRPAILVPYAAAMDDHQTTNASRMVEAGAGLMIPEAELSVQRLAEAVASVLSNPERAHGMAQSSRDRGRPDAVKALGDLVESLGAK